MTKLDEKLKDITPEELYERCKKQIDTKKMTFAQYGKICERYLKINIKGTHEPTTINRSGTDKAE